MGIAIIVPDADFSSVGLGRVTLTGNVPILNVQIVGPSSVAGATVKYEAVFTPSNTTQRSVVWSIVSGGAYATINQSGVLNIMPGANSNLVKIRLTSSFDNSIFAEKSVTVSYTQGNIIQLGNYTWSRGERLPDGTINQGSSPYPWGYCSTPFVVSGANSITPNVPVGMTDYIIETLYYDANDQYIGYRYLCCQGYWTRFNVQVDTLVPSGAAKMYINIAGPNVLFDASIANGVSLIVL